MKPPTKAIAKVINPTIYNKMLNDSGNFVLVNDSSDYQMIDNASISEANIYDMNDQLLEIIISK